MMAAKRNGSLEGATKKPSIGIPPKSSTSPGELKYQQILLSSEANVQKPKRPRDLSPIGDTVHTNGHSRFKDGLELPPTRIPAKYHMTEVNPIPRHNGDSAFPSGRREVQQLVHTFNMMLEELKAEEQAAIANGSKSEGTISIDQIKKEQEVYDIVLNEIIRQVQIECFDRGKLLQRVTTRYSKLFQRIPAILAQLQQEIDSLLEANKSLRNLLQRFMEEKSALELENRQLQADMGNVEKARQAQQTEIADLKSQLQEACIERDKAKDELRQLQENFMYSTQVQRQQSEREEQLKETIKKLTVELEKAISRQHGSEAKDIEELLNRPRLNEDGSTHGPASALSAPTLSSSRSPSELYSKSPRKDTGSRSLLPSSSRPSTPSAIESARNGPTRKRTATVSS